MVEVLSEADQMELYACEEVVSSGWNTFVQVGLALARIRDRKLYRIEFHRFETYCQAKWQYGRNYVNRLISAAQVFTHLVPGRPERSPAQAPLGTVLESFPSSRLEPLTKTNLGRGDPAISCGCESLERLAYLCPAEKVRGYQEDKCAQRSIAVSQSTQYLRGRRGWRRPGP